ncbi:MAG: glycerol-3-phosphate dehydrogenase [Candidatus Fonsibacter lacus]|nr:glycerol-3-phosphate dehydrogenase [Candidatus Fonsibacter lacus]
MAKILILGAGSMSTAFAFPCSDNNHKVSIVGTHLEDNFIDIIKSNKNTHPVLKSKIPDNVKIYKFDSFNDLLKDADLIVIGVSSKGINWASEQLIKIKNNQQILILTKGLHVNKKNRYEVYSDTVKNILLKNGIKNLKISVAAGPCLASNLSNKVLTNVIFANKKISVVKKLSKLLTTSYYKIKCSNDVIGVAACGGIKNIYAMIVGTSIGINLKNENDNKNLNAAATLFNQSIIEMCHFIKKIGGKNSTVLDLAGVGDLYVSCTGGRNSKMGKFIGMGMTYKNAKLKKMPNETVEGADLIFEIGKKIVKDFTVTELPLMTTFIKALLNNTKFNVNRKIFYKC